MSLPADQAPRRLVSDVGSRALALLLLALQAVGAAAAARRTSVRRPRSQKGRIERIVVATGTIEPEKRGRGPAAHLGHHREDPRRGRRRRSTHGRAAGRDRARAARRAGARGARRAARASRVELRFAEIDVDRGDELEHERHDVGARSATRAQARYETRARPPSARDAARRSRRSRSQLSYATVTAPMRRHDPRRAVEVGDAVSPVTAVTGGTLLLVDRRHRHRCT